MNRDKLTAMKTIALELEDGLAARFERACRLRGHGEVEVASALFRRYLEVQQLRHCLSEKHLEKVYGTLAEEDVALAEAGMGDFQPGLIQDEQS